MAGKVLGVPVTNEALKSMAKYAGKEISQLDRATEALNKKDEALRSLEEMEKIIPGQGPTTICMFYNATGDPIYFVTDKNWHGYLKSRKFPEKIENGQWGVFTHSSMLTEHTTGSAGAVVYRAKNIVSGDKNDWMFSWYHGFLSKEVVHKAYTEMGEAGHFQGEEVWNEIKQQTENAKDKTFCEWKIYAAHVEIDDENPAHYKAVLSLRINEQPATK